MREYPCPTCGVRQSPTMTTDPEGCLHCGELLEFHPRGEWLVVPQGSYEPMDRAAADAVIARYTPWQPVTLTANHAAELAEAIQVKAGASRAQVYAMRETFLGPGVND